MQKHNSTTLNTIQILLTYCPGLLQEKNMMVTILSHVLLMAPQITCYLRSTITCCPLQTYLILRYKSTQNAQDRITRGLNPLLSGNTFKQNTGSDSKHQC